MSAGDPPSSRRRKTHAHLSDEDRALWNHVARSVSAPRRAKSRVPDVPGLDPLSASESAVSLLQQQLKSESSLSEPAAAGKKRKTAQSSPLAPPDLPHPTRQKTPPLADFDRKAVRRIRSGRIEIEARLDLHGMRQDEAHWALRSFLGGCQARGLRWVLVITGKGRAAGDHEPAAPVHLGEGRGVLRRSVPRWLAEPDLRSLIVSYTTAALHHGGEGALYIQLRARRGSG